MEIYTLVCNIKYQLPEGSSFLKVAVESKPNMATKEFCRVVAQTSSGMFIRKLPYLVLWVKRVYEFGWRAGTG